MIAAVVVVYQPNLVSLHSLYSSLIRQVQHLVVVNNSASETEKPDWFLSREGGECHWLDLPANLGIAGGHNAGIEYAKPLAVAHVVLFDQDSTVAHGFVCNLLHAKEQVTARGVKLACIGPRPFCTFESRPVIPRVQKHFQQVGNVTLVRQIIASGMLISMQVLEEVGLKETGLFIDGVDHEWCWRAQKLGYSIGLCESVLMPHRLGEGRGHFLGITYKVGSPERLYYQFRNILTLSRRDYVPVYWKARNLLAIPFRFLLMSLFEEPRGARCRYMLKGLWHGLMGRTGSFH